METLWQDIRYGLRTLGKNKGFTAVAVIVLALGIGANTAVFSLVHALLLTPVPGVAEPERIVRIGRTYKGDGFDTGSWLNYLDYRERNTVFSDIAVHTARGLNLSNGERTERLNGGLVSGNYFRMVGAWPYRGRLLTLEDNLEEGQHPLVVLSYSTWQRMFGGDENLVGKTATVNGKPYRVIGITQPGFRGTAMSGQNVDAWVPIKMVKDFVPFLGDLSLFELRNATWFYRQGRLKPGVTLEQAQAEMDVIAAQLRQEYPEMLERNKIGVLLVGGVGIYPGREENLKTILLLLGSLVGMVLLIACANAANLLLARASQRQKEMAVRSALGAGRTRLLRQLLTEGVLLWLLGGTAGFLLAIWLSQALWTLAPNRLAELPFGGGSTWEVLGFGLGISLLTGVVFAFIPALQATRIDLASGLREGGRSTGAAGAWLRKGFVVVQVASVVIMLVGAGLLTRTLTNLQSIEIGFDSSNLLTVGIDPGLNAYLEEAGRNFFDELLPRLRALPGVEQAGMAITMPLNRSNWGLTIKIDGAINQRGGENLSVDFNTVTPGYFKMMGVELVAGREFTEQDTQDSEAVAVINQAMVNKWFKDRNPVGEVVRFTREERPTRIVGVIRDIKTRRLTSGPRQFFYVPQSQYYVPDQYLHLKTRGNPYTVLPQVRELVRRMDPNLPLTDIRTMDERIAAFLSAQSSRAVFVNAFSVLALLLASVGLYGVMAFAVSQRTHEIGIRMALGAQRTSILQMILKQGLGVTLVGVVIGLGGALGLVRFLESFLYGVTTTDPLTFAGVALMLLLTATLACLVPARRAAQVEPMVALRYE